MASLWALGNLGWRELAKRVWREIQEDEVFGRAAELSYYFLLALFPRMLNLGLFPTSDEDSWMRRTGGFTFGLVNGQLGRTYQNGHPGVTTMWIDPYSAAVSSTQACTASADGVIIVVGAPRFAGMP